MTPPFSTNNVTDALSGNSKLVSDGFKSKSLFSQLNNLKHFLLLQFGCPTGFSFWRNHPALSHAILPIIIISSQEQMIWVAAFSIIALVTNQHSLRDGANGQFISKSMCSFRFPMCDRKNSVTSMLSLSNITYPRPAFIMAEGVHIAPKTFYQWNWSKNQMGRIATKPIFTLLMYLLGLIKFSKGKCVSNSMSHLISSLHLNLPITIASSSDPQPTFIFGRNLNMAPKSFFQSFGFVTRWINHVRDYQLFKSLLQYNSDLFNFAPFGSARLTNQRIGTMM